MKKKKEREREREREKEREREREMCDYIQTVFIIYIIQSILKRKIFSPF